MAEPPDDDFERTIASTEVPAARPPLARPSSPPGAIRPPPARPPTSPAPLKAPPSGVAPRPPVARPASLAKVPAAPSPTSGAAKSVPAAKKPDVEIEIGALFAGRYRIEKQLGKGGMGAVYLATQELLNRKVAIKLLHTSGDDVTAARFQREARVIAQCQHPNIVNLIDFGEDEGRLFLVMEFIDGLPLTKLIASEAPFDAKRVCDIGIQVAEALSVAHDINVVHRDLKPDNIMVQQTAGHRDFIKILDFGVAKIKRDPAENMQNTVETKAGLIVGSLRYISPEQVDSGDISTRTDLYSFGCVLYEMLAGRRVFEYPSPADCAIAHLTEMPKPPSVQGVTLEGPLVDFIMQCLQKKPVNRPENGRAAAEALIACREAPLRNARPAQGDASEARTVAMMQVPIEALQANKTISTQVPRPATVTAMDAEGNSVRPKSEPAPVPNTGSSKRPDAPLRRPSSMAGLEIVGADVPHTATHLDGMRLQPKAAPVDARKSKAWLWILIAVLVLGGAAAVLLVTRPWESGATAGPTTTSEPTQAATATEPTEAPTTAPPTKETPTTVAATAAEPDATVATDTAEAPSEVAAAEPEVAPVVPKGYRLTSTPEEAEVLQGGKVIGKTPFTVDWPEGSEPPTLRISKKGFVEVDMQLLESDRGKERNVQLRPATP